MKLKNLFLGLMAVAAVTACNPYDEVDYAAQLDGVYTWEGSSYVRTNTPVQGENYIDVRKDGMGLYVAFMIWNSVEEEYSTIGVDVLYDKLCAARPEGGEGEYDEIAIENKLFEGGSLQFNVNGETVTLNAVQPKSRYLGYYLLIEEPRYELTPLEEAPTDEGDPYFYVKEDAIGTGLTVTKYVWGEGEYEEKDSYDVTYEQILAAQPQYVDGKWLPIEFEGTVKIVSLTFDNSGAVPALEVTEEMKEIDFLGVYPQNKNDYRNILDKSITGEIAGRDDIDADYVYVLSFDSVNNVYVFEHFRKNGTFVKQNTFYIKGEDNLFESVSLYPTPSCNAGDEAGAAIIIVGEDEIQLICVC